MFRVGFLYFLLLPFCSFAQKETNIWCFGRNSQVDFNSGSPVVSTANSSIYTNEGCASICDPAGNLLFYTDGTFVWDKTHAMMPNGWGMWGNTSSTQSGVIIPAPGSSTLYYVFSVDAQAGYFGASTSLYGGVSYSIVDITLNGGNGDITTKNQPLLTPACEKITAVKHCNGRDIWVIVHEWNTNGFYAYLVTSAGIGSPVISNSGSVHADLSGGMNNETIGYMKASPNGKKIACVSYSYSNTLEIFDFCNATGIVSNPITDNAFVAGSGFPTANEGLYGLSFSPDNSRLYVSWFSNYYVDSIYGGAYSYLFPSKIYQYDMNAGSSAAIIASKTVVVSANRRFGALQIASDGKIYVTSVFDNKLDVINNPNTLGTACGYQQGAVTLPVTMTAVYGLPDFIESYFNESPKSDLGPDRTLACGAGAQILDAGKYPCGNFLWSTGETTQAITVNQSGTYWVNVGNCFTDTIVILYNTNCSLPVVQSTDTSVCSGACASIQAVGSGGTLPYVFTWSNGNTGAGPHSICPLTSTNYTVTITDALNNASVTVVNVTVNPAVNVSVMASDASCSGNNGSATAGVTGGTGPFSYLWTNGAAASSINNLAPGNYAVTVTDAKGCFNSASISISQPGAVTLVAGPDQSICEGQTANITATATGGTSSTYTYSWSSVTATDITGNISVSPVVTTKYIVSVNNGCGGYAYDSVFVYVNSTPQIIFSADVVSGCAPLGVQFADASFVNGGTIGTWLWDFGDGSSSSSANPAHQFNTPGEYDIRLTVTSARGCTNTLVKTKMINVWPSPRAGFNYSVIDDGSDDNVVSFIDVSTNASEWTWDFNDNAAVSADQNPVHQFSDTGKYNVKLVVANTYGCKDSIVKEVALVAEYSLFIPNAFTPNYDLMNQFFTPAGNGIKTFKMLVFDRWGLELFSTNDILKGWDGAFKGKDCQQDVYVYRIVVADWRDKEHEYVGAITLLR